MLIGFTFNNFCSFNIESEFSMEASTGKVKMRFPDNYTAIQIFDVFGETINDYTLNDWFMTSESDLDRQLRAADANVIFPAR